MLRALPIMAGITLSTIENGSEATILGFMYPRSKSCRHVMWDRDQIQDLVSGALVGCCMTKAISAQNGLAAPGPGTRGLKCGQPASRRPYACAGPGSPGVIRLSR